MSVGQTIERLVLAVVVLCAPSPYLSGQGVSVENRLNELKAFVVHDPQLPGNPITRVNVAGTRADDADMVLLAALPHLRSLNISNTFVSPRGIKKLLVNTAIRELHVERLDLRDRHIHLFARTHIEVLSLADNPRITGRGFRGCDLSHVLEMNLSGCDLHGRRLRSLSLSCPNLKRIVCGTIDIRSGVLETFSQIPHLEELDLTSSRFGDERMAELAGAECLTRLTLFETPVSDLGLRWVAGATGLRELNAGNTRVTGEALPCFPNLKTVRLGGEDVQLDFSRIAQASSLKDVTISSESIATDSLHAFHNGPDLDSVTLFNCRIRRGALAHIRPSRLAIWRCRFEPPEGSGTLFPEELTKMEIDDTELTPADIAAISEIRKLKYVNMSVTHLSDAAVQSLLTLTNVDRIDLSVTHLKSSARKQLADGLPNLRLRRR